MIIELFGIEINWPSQILGLIGCAFCIYSFFLNEKHKFLFYCTIGYLFCIGEAVLLLFTGNNTYANIIATVIAVIRNILMYIFLNKGKEVPVYIGIIFTLLIWLTAIPFYSEWYTFIPPLAMTITTVALIFKNFILTKAANVVFELLYVTYGIVVGAYSGIIRDGFGLITAIISIALYIKESKK